MIPTDFSIRRRAERVSSFDATTCCFLDCPALSPDRLPILDISELGAKFSLQNCKSGISSRDLFVAKLILGEGFSCTIRFRLIYFSGKTAGIEFIHSPRQVSHLICNYYRHELLGATLRPMKSAGREDILRFSDNGPNWLELSLRQGKLESFSADLLSIGIHLKWSRERGDLAALGGFFKESPRNPGTRDLLRIIRNIPELTSDLKIQLESAILNSECRKN